MNTTQYKNIQFFQNHTFYPQVCFNLVDINQSCNPINEKVMSLLKSIDVKRDLINLKIDKKYTAPLFFFIYNFDNYYHFVYDTLPYLINFFELRKEYKNLKLLVNFPRGQNKLNKFVLEFLDLLGITDTDLVFVDDTTIYSCVFVSDSFTYNAAESGEPDPEVYKFFKGISKLVDTDETLPKKIYVSRRTHKHGNYENIGTNYTTRRKLINEDELVSFLTSIGYTEVFTELLDTKTKISMFKGCTDIVGAIGGGLCNTLFSKPSTKLKCIISPYFLDVNKRFTYSFKYMDTVYFNQTENAEKALYKKYMRVNIPSKNIIGEIQEVSDTKLLVAFDENKLSGWNSNVKYNTIEVNISEVEPLDLGLNSSWIMDLENFKKELFT